MTSLPVAGGEADASSLLCFSYDIVAPGRGNVNIFLRKFCIFHRGHGTLRAYTVRKRRCPAWLRTTRTRTRIRIRTKTAKMRTRSKTSRPRSATESADREPVLSSLESMGSRTVSARLFAPPSDYIIFLQAVKQIHLAGVRHTRKGPQSLQLLDMGLGQLAAAHGKLFHGDEGLALALFYRVLGGGLP